MIFKDYSVIKEISSKGAQGIIYYAQNTLGSPVAIKVLSNRHFQNPKLLMHFEKEARIMAALRHDHIVSVRDFYQDETQAAIIMEYLDGCDLESYVRNAESELDQMRLKTVMTWYEQLLPAFQYAHSKGLVHRDVKPSNIFLTHSGQIKVLDFGIAKVLDEAQIWMGIGGMSTITHSGTPYYKSPEHVLRPLTVNHLTDIYALGLMFYILATGTEPYDNDQLVEDILNKELPVVEDLPEPIYKVLLKATAKKREERYSDCMVFMEDLRAAYAMPLDRKESEVQISTFDTEFPEVEKVAGNFNYGVPPVDDRRETKIEVYSEDYIKMMALLGGFVVYFPMSINFRSLGNSEQANELNICGGLLYIIFFSILLGHPGISMVEFTMIYIIAYAMMVIHLAVGALPEITSLTNKLRSAPKKREAQVNTLVICVIIHAVFLTICYSFIN